MNIQIFGTKKCNDTRKAERLSLIHIFLFESYLRIVEHFKPKALVFENVPGLLSAKPGDTPITRCV